MGAVSIKVKIAGKNWRNLKWLNYGFVSCRHTAFCFKRILIDGLESSGLFSCFISCLDSHSDGTHSLHRIHWLIIASEKVSNMMWQK